MQLTMFDALKESQPQSFSGRTCQEFSTQRTTPSDAFWQDLPVKSYHYSRQGGSGQTRVVCLVPKEQSRGAYLMPNISEWPNDADVCSLSQVLETTSIPQRFFLSGKACAGILRRAEKRGKQLPAALHSALETAATHGRLDT
jgi:hypothetical protein